jgi:hypothetical protein
MQIGSQLHAPSVLPRQNILLINIFAKPEGLQSVATVWYGHEKQRREKVLLGTEFWLFCA